MTLENCQYEVLRSWAEVDQATLQGLSERLTDLKGKTIGLFDSMKAASKGVLTVVEEELNKRLPSTTFTWFSAGFYYHGQPYYREPQEQEWKRRFEAWLKEVDAVILAQGD